MKSARFIVILAAIEMCFLPWMSQWFDTGAFLNTVDRTFYAGVSPVAWWPFGLISLGIIMLSQTPFLLIPTWYVNVPVRILLLKTPFFAADIGSALLLARAAQHKLRSKWIAPAAFLSPAVIYTTVIHGTFDALANVTVVAAILAIVNGRAALCGLFLGLGAGIKYYPAFLLPLAAVLLAKTHGKRSAIICIATGSAVAIATILPVHLLNPYSTSSVVQNTTGVNALVSVSPWSLYFFVLTQMPTGLKLFFAATAALFPTLLGLWLLTRSKPAITPAIISRAFAEAIVGIVLLNPGCAPQFFSWMVGPVALATIFGNRVWPLFIVSIIGLCAVAIEILAEGSSTFVRGSFEIVRDPQITHPDGTMWFLSLTIVILSLALVSYYMVAEIPARESSGGRSSGRHAWAIGSIVVGSLTLVTVAILATTTVRWPPLRDLGNRARLNDFSLAPRSVLQRPHRGCVITFDASAIGFVQQHLPMSFSLVSLNVQGRPPAITSSGARIFRSSAWQATSRNALDFSLATHLTTTQLPLMNPSFSRSASIAFQTTPCAGSSDPTLGVDLDILAAERHYFRMKR